jgi:hypothetical protein
MRMKDLKRKNRDWDNDNHIMRKYGKNIRRNIAETLVKAQRPIVLQRAIVRAQKLLLARIPKDECAEA